MVSVLATIIVGVPYNLAPEVDYSLLPNDIINIQVVDPVLNTDLLPVPQEANQVCYTTQLNRRKFRLVRKNGVSLFPNGFFGMCR